MNTNAMRICRKVQFSHHNRRCTLQGNRGAYDRHGCLCPWELWQASDFPGGCLSLPIRWEKRPAAPKGARVEKSTPVLLILSFGSANYWLALNNYLFLCFPFLWHFIDTSILRFRFHQKRYGCSSVRSLCVPGTLLTALLYTFIM